MAEWHANIGSDSMARKSYPGSLVMLHNPSACMETSAESILSQFQANGVSLQSFTSSLQPEALFILKLVFSYRQFTFEDCQGCVQMVRGICCHQEHNVCHILQCPAIQPTHFMLKNHTLVVRKYNAKIVSISTGKSTNHYDKPHGAAHLTGLI
jgi:hypothetical protein